MGVTRGEPISIEANVWNLWGTGSPVGVADADRGIGSRYLQTDASPAAATWRKTAANNANAWTLEGDTSNVYTVGYALRRTSDLAFGASQEKSLGLSFAYKAGQAWCAHYRLYVTVAAGAVGLTFKLGSLPADATGRIRSFGTLGGVAAVTSDVTANLTTAGTAYLTAAFTGFVELWLDIAEGSADGTIDLRAVSGLLADATILKGSHVILSRAA